MPNYSEEVTVLYEEVPLGVKDLPNTGVGVASGVIAVTGLGMIFAGLLLNLFILFANCCPHIYFNGLYCFLFGDRDGAF